MTAVRAARAAQRREELIIDHMRLAKRIAWRVFGMLTRAGQGGYTSPIDIADVEGWAMIGLCQAAAKYKKSKGSFAAYAYRRIRGAAIDAYKRRAYADMLHVSADQLIAEIGEEEGATDFTPLIFHIDHSPLPDQLAAESERERLLAAAIAELPEDERAVLRKSLAGEKLVCISAAHGRSATWGRAKLDQARRKVTAAVEGKRAA